MIRSAIFINRLLDRRDKIKVLIIAAFVLFGALLEAASISMIVPYVNVLTSVSDQSGVVELLGRFVDITAPETLIMYLSVILCVFYVVKNAFMMLLTYTQNQFVYKKQAFFSQNLLSAYLNKPYEFFFTANSAQLQRNINVLIPNIMQGVFLPLMLLFTEIVVTVGIILLLAYKSPLITIQIVLFIGIAGGGISRGIKKQTLKLGVDTNDSLANMVKWVNQSIGAVREIKISRNESDFIEQYNSQCEIFTDSVKKYSIYTQIPRYGLEMIAITLMVFVVLSKVSHGYSASAMSDIGLFAMASFRMIPSVNRIINYSTTLRYNANTIDIVSEDINWKQISPPVGMKKFHYSMDAVHEICFKEVTYRYPGKSEDALKKVNITIKENECVGIVGPSGSGKSTFADLLAGLIEPTEGTVTIGGTASSSLGTYNCRIGYVSQQSYILDGSVRSNITLSRVELDDRRIWEVLKVAQLAEYVRSLEKGLDTIIGERGVCFSGGQIQRIGIARALYNDPDIVIMDEATSALDSETERLMTDAINALAGAKTLIIIAHRESTLKNCNVIYEIINGEVHKVFGNRRISNNKEQLELE